MKSSLLTTTVLALSIGLFSQAAMSTGYIKIDGIDGESKDNEAKKVLSKQQKETALPYQRSNSQNNLKQLGTATKQKNNDAKIKYGPVITVKPKG